MHLLAETKLPVAERLPEELPGRQSGQGRRGDAALPGTAAAAGADPAEVGTGDDSAACRGRWQAGRKGRMPAAERDAGGCRHGGMAAAEHGDAKTGWGDVRPMAILLLLLR